MKLVEQRRTVANADQLMALVDELETQLTASRAIAVSYSERHAGVYAEAS